MIRDAKVLEGVERAETILREHGVTDFCRSCIKGPKGGCCQGCSALGPTGCLTKPLSCAVWLCQEVKIAFPKANDQLVQIRSMYPLKIGHGYRLESIKAECTMVAATS